MATYVAFLRGMNVGGHRITNTELCEVITDLGFTDVTAFLASGNVILKSKTRAAPDSVARKIEKGLKAALSYAVPTFLRTADEVHAIAAQQPFAQPFEALATAWGKPQIAMLQTTPTKQACRTALAEATEDDQLAIVGPELYWLPRGKLTDSALDHKAIESALGPLTVRTRNTIVRLSAKL